MEFGVPKRREAGSSKEKYENVAVLTVSEFKGKGTGRTISLNAKAIEGLGIDFENPEVLISFSFDKLASRVSIANTTGLEGMSGVRLAKTSKSVSDKSYFEAIKSNFNVKVEDSAEFLLTETGGEFNGQKVLSLSLMGAVDIMNETVSEAVAETNPEIADVIVAPSGVLIEVVADEIPIEHIMEQSAIQSEAEAEIEVENAFVEPVLETVQDEAKAESDFFAGFN